MVDSGFTVCASQSMSQALKSQNQWRPVTVSGEGLNVSQVLLYTTWGKGRCARDALPHTYDIGVFKAAKRTPPL